MRDRTLFWRFFLRMLLVFLALWTAMAGVLVWNNRQWHRQEIQQRLGMCRYYVKQEMQERTPYRANLDGIAHNLVSYQGQIALRSYDRWGNVTNRSQLLMGSFLIPETSEEVYMMFDEVLTEEEELELARRLIELKREVGGDDWTGYLTLSSVWWEEPFSFEISGVKDFNRLFPLRLVFHRGEETVTLLDLGPERYQNRQTTELVNRSLFFFGGLMMGPGAPEERLKVFRRLEANLDRLEEGMERNAERTDYMVSMLPERQPNQGTMLYEDGDYTLAYSYQVDPCYLFYGLEHMLVWTFLGAVLLAVFTAFIQARAVRRERAFTRAAAHELKTPLAVLRTHAEALREDIAPEKRERYLDVILDESDRMNALVGQLLDLSRLEAGAELRREPVELKALIEAVFARLGPAAQGEGIMLALDLQPLRVEGDPRRLEELVTELGANAIRHCPAGGGVRVSLCREGRKARLKVENDGLPIPARDLSRLWEPFYRGDKSRSRESGGSGLGLALVRGTAEAHKGTCWAENCSGGVCFTVELSALQSEP